MISLIGNATTFAAKPKTVPLNIDVQAAFKPVLTRLKPMIERRLNVTLALRGKTPSDIYQDITTRGSVDLVILNNDGMLNTLEIKRQIVPGSLVPLVSSQLALWCPSERIQMRVGIGDILNGVQALSLAVASQTLSTPHRGVQTVLDNISPKVRLINTSNYYEAWQMAHQKQADCAVTFRSLIPPEQMSRVRIFPRQLIQITGAVPMHSRQPEAARQVLDFLSTPLLHATLQSFGYQ